MLWTLLAALLMLLFPLRVQWVQQPKKIPSSFPLVIVLPEAPAVSTWAEPARKARVLLFCSFPKGAWYFLAKPNAEFLRGGCWRRILALWLQNLKGDKLVFRLLWQRHNQNMIYSHTWPLPRHKQGNNEIQVCTTGAALVCGSFWGRGPELMKAGQGTPGETNPTWLLQFGA